MRGNTLNYFDKQNYFDVNLSHLSVIYSNIGSASVEKQISYLICMLVN